MGEGHGNPLQCSCLENARGRGAWWAAVCGVAQGWTRLRRLGRSSKRPETVLSDSESCAPTIPTGFRAGAYHAAGASGNLTTVLHTEFGPGTLGLKPRYSWKRIPKRPVSTRGETDGHD